MALWPPCASYARNQNFDGCFAVCCVPAQGQEETLLFTTGHVTVDNSGETTVVVLKASCPAERRQAEALGRVLCGGVAG